MHLALEVHTQLSSDARRPEYTVVKKTHSTSRLMNHWIADACVRRTMPEGEAAVRRRTHRELPRVSFAVVELGPSDRDAGWYSAQELWSVSRIDVVKRPED